MKSNDSTLTNVTTLPETCGPYQTDNENTFIATRPDKGSPKNPRDHRYNDVIKTSSRPSRRGTEWGRKHGEESHPRMQSIKRQERCKGFGTELESNSREVSSSTESLDSILSPQIDRPPVIELLGQSSSDVLGSVNRGPQSNTSGSSGTYRRQEDIVNEGIPHRSERLRESTHPSSHGTRSGNYDTHSNRRETRQNIRDTNLSQRDTQSHKHDTHSRQKETNSDTYLHHRATHENVRETHSRKRDAPEGIRNAQLNERNLHLNENDALSQKRDTHKNTWDTHSPQRDTRSNQHAQSAREPTKVHTHPVIKSGNSSKMTPSLRRPVGDVLPSKPLSPASRSPGKFSYTMHSRKTNK